MTHYRLVTMAVGASQRSGVVVDGRVFDTAAITHRPEFAAVRAILDNWLDADEAITSAIQRLPEAAVAPSLAEVTLLSPLAEIGSIYCAGANYHGHAKEMALAHGRPEPRDPHDTGQQPWHFLKSPTTVVGDDATVGLPQWTARVDWEVELAVFIGRTAKDVPLGSGLEVVAGYAIANDLSARDRLVRAATPESSPFHYDWLWSKHFDGACPLGPWIVPSSAVPDPQNLKISLSVNGHSKQDSNTSDMIFSVDEQIAHLSSMFTLHPGDVILTGTPAGVGSTKGEFLEAGDIAVARIESIGALTTRFT